MPIKSRMERALADRKEANLDNVVNEYDVSHAPRFSTRFILSLCAVIAIVILLMFIPAQNSVLVWARATIVVVLVLGAIALIIDRSTHLR